MEHNMVDFVIDTNRLEERLLDEAQVQALFPPPFLGGSLSIPQPMVSDV